MAAAHSPMLGQRLPAQQGKLFTILQPGLSLLSESRVNHYGCLERGV